MLQATPHCPPTLRPPEGFRPAGAVRFGMLCHEPAFVEAAYSRQPALFAGQRYEARVHEALGAAFPDEYVRSPWFAFSGLGGMRYCQADALLFDFAASRITILEMKMHHCAEAYWQLEHLYRPVVQATFGPLWEVQTCEVCRDHDPAVLLPAREQLVRTFDECDAFAFNVMMRGA